jgi:YD repeat-containing protein
MVSKIRALLVIILLTFFVSGAAGAYTPFYEMTAPTRLGSMTSLLGGHVDTGTGAFCYRNHLSTVLGYINLNSDIIFNSQDRSAGPFGIGTSTSYDWFVVKSVLWPGQPWVLIGPGNRHFIFDQGGSGNFVDPRDAQFLGASLSFNGPPSGRLCTLTFKNWERWEFDLSGGLVTIHTHWTDYGWNTINITRNANGFPVDITQSTSPTWRGIEYTYGGSPLTCTNVTNWYNWVSNASPGITRPWNFTYSGGNTQIATISDPANRISRLNWTGYTRSDGALLPLISSMVDNRGNTAVSITYDSSGRVTNTTLPVSGSLAFSYSAPLGSDGYTQIVQANGDTKRNNFQWLTAHHGYLITSTTDVTLGETTTIEHSAVSSVYPTITTYLPSAVVDYLGHRSTVSWDTKLGNLLSMTYPAPTGGTATLSYQYDAVYNEVAVSTDPLGNRSTRVINPHTGDVTSTTDPLGNVTSHTYNSAGACLSTTDPLGYTTSYSFDTNGVLVSTVDALNHTTSYTRDVLGQLTNTTDALGRMISFVYNPSGTIQSKTALYGPNPITESSTYDANDNRISSTSPNGTVWSYSYDSANRMVQSTDPLGNSKHWIYNPDNTQASYQDAIGQRFENTYDSAGRLTLQNFKLGNGSIESSITYTYDPTTHLVSSYTDSAIGSPTSLTRDSFLENTSVVQPYGTIGQTYDILGRALTKTVTGQAGVTYHYNSLGQMDTETQNGQTTTFLYDKVGRLIQQNFPNGVINKRTLDGNGRVIRATSTSGASTISDTVYTRDAAGNISTSQENGGAVFAYSYDYANRLTQISQVGDSRGDGYPSYGFQYDVVGNKVKDFSNPPGVQYSSNLYSYDSANNLVAINGFGVYNDANGNPYQAQNRFGGSFIANYTWDVRGRLVAFSYGSQVYSFKYFSSDIPAQQVINGTTTNFVRTGSDILADITNGITTTTLNSPVFGQPLNRGGMWQSTNGTGSTKATTNGSGSVVNTYTYTPTGVSTQLGNGSGTPFQFNRTYNTGATGVYQSGSRIYDPTTGNLLGRPGGVPHSQGTPSVPNPMASVQGWNPPSRKLVNRVLGMIGSTVLLGAAGDFPEVNSVGGVNAPDITIAPSRAPTTVSVAGRSVTLPPSNRTILPLPAPPPPPAGPHYGLGLSNAGVDAMEHGWGGLDDFRAQVGGWSPGSRGGPWTIPTNLAGAGKISFELAGLNWQTAVLADEDIMFSNNVTNVEFQMSISPSMWDRVEWYLYGVRVDNPFAMSPIPTSQATPPPGYAGGPGSDPWGNYPSGPGTE